MAFDHQRPEPFCSHPTPATKFSFVIADGYHLEHGTAAPSSSGLGYASNPGHREEAMVHTVDMFATVAGIAGVTATAEDSVSMLSQMGTGSVRLFNRRQYLYTERCTSAMYQAAIRNDQYKFIYRFNYNTSTLDQELYAVSDLEEVNNLFDTGVPDEAVLLAEMNSMWASEGYDPQIACP